MGREIHKYIWRDRKSMRHIDIDINSQRDREMERQSDKHTNKVKDIC